MDVNHVIRCPNMAEPAKFRVGRVDSNDIGREVVQAPRSLLTNFHLTNGVGQRSSRLAEVGRRVGVYYPPSSSTRLTLLML